MAACIRFEDQLDGISNYLQWKVRMSAVLKENKIWNYVSSVVVVLVIHQFAQAGFPEEPPENEQAVLIFADFRVQWVL